MDDTLNSMETTGEIPTEPSPSANAGPEIEAPETEKPPSRSKRFLKRLGWMFFAFFCLAFFTLIKLPEDKIQNYVQGMISSQLSAQGINLTAAKSSISIGFGISYTMKDVTLSFAPPQEPVHIDQISVSPTLLSMFTGKIGARVEIENKGGRLRAAFSTPMSGPNGPVAFEYHATQLDLGALGVLSGSIGVKGSAILNGEGHVEGDTSLPATLSGKLDADLAKIVLDQQMFMGFSIPRLSISEGKTEITIDGGKAILKTFRFGKPSSTTDDIRANITGDVTLGKNLSYSTLNLKANFSLSQNILKAFILLDTILGPAKQADGSYTYAITGPLNSPNPVPAGSPAGAGAGATPSAPPAAPAQSSPGQAQPVQPSPARPIGH